MKTRSISCHPLRPANIWSLIAGLTISLRFLGAQVVAVAGDASADIRPQNNYALVLEITSKEGAPERFSFVSAGGRLEASFVSGQAEINGSSVPLLSSLKAELEPLQDGKMWLSQLNLMHTVPYVTGFSEYGGGNVAPTAVRAIPGRTKRPGEDGGKSADAATPAEPPNQPAPPRPMTRSVVQQANIGITTSLVLTIGKAVTLFEDSRQRIRLTVDKVQD